MLPTYSPNIPLHKPNKRQMANIDEVKLSLSDKVKVFSTLSTFPIVLAGSLVAAPFRAYVREKPWSRVAADRFLLWFVSNLSPREMRGFSGSTLQIYKGFVKRRGLPRVIEEIGDDAKLLWVGPKYTEKVMLFFHGGGFVVSMPPGAAEFWAFVQGEMANKGTPVGLAILNFTLMPDAPFPTQLKQAVLAVQHILDSGVMPQNIHLVGDSAGGALIHGILSHMLHPLEGLPKLHLSSPLGGAFMMSPWTRMVDKDGCLYTNDGKGDFLDAQSIIKWGSIVVDGVPESIIPYLEANNAPSNWLEGMEKLVQRVMITGGGAETLRDEIIKYASVVKKHHKDVTFVVQENGIHNDPYMDFYTGREDLGDLTPLILEWLGDGFSKTT